MDCRVRVNLKANRRNGGVYNYHTETSLSYVSASIKQYVRTIILLRVRHERLDRYNFNNETYGTRGRSQKRIVNCSTHWKCKYCVYEIFKTEIVD